MQGWMKRHVCPLMDVCAMCAGFGQSMPFPFSGVLNFGGGADERGQNVGWMDRAVRAHRWQKETKEKGNQINVGGLVCFTYSCFPYFRLSTHRPNPTCRRYIPTPLPTKPNPINPTNRGKGPHVHNTTALKEKQHQPTFVSRCRFCSSCIRSIASGFSDEKRSCPALSVFVVVCVGVVGKEGWMASVFMQPKPNIQGRRAYYARLL